MQHVLNIAARILTKSKCQAHITHVLKALHWPPIDKRIEFICYMIIVCVRSCKHGEEQVGRLLLVRGCPGSKFVLAHLV